MLDCLRQAQSGNNKQSPEVRDFWLSLYIDKMLIGLTDRSLLFPLDTRNLDHQRLDWRAVSRHSVCPMLSTVPSLAGTVTQPLTNDIVSVLALGVTRFAPLYPSDTEDKPYDDPPPLLPPQHM